MYLKEFLMKEGGELITEISALVAIFLMAYIIYLLGVADWMRKKGNLMIRNDVLIAAVRKANGCIFLPK